MVCSNNVKWIGTLGLALIIAQLALNRWPLAGTPSTPVSIVANTCMPDPQSPASHRLALFRTGGQLGTAELRTCRSGFTLGG